MQKGRHSLLSTTSLTRSVKLAVTAGAMMFAAAPAWAVDDLATPTGENVVGGSASFDRPAAGQLNVNQATDRVVINWDSFNIGGSATTQFYQPGTGSLAVNRVVGAGQDPTQILGTLKANGRVMVLDRNGVFFGRDAKLDVGGIIASTGDIDPAAVMSGSGSIELKNFGDGAIINEGSISAQEAGLVAFVGKHVANRGVITAKLGKVALAAGSTRATVDLYGDGLVEFALDGAQSKVLAENDGVINAAGGTVAMTAVAAKDVVDNVINMKGIVDVSSVTVKGGKIILGGGKSGNVSVSGKLNASGTSGGTIAVTGKNVEVTKTSTIVNNAGDHGDGGDTLIYGDDYALFNGTLFGRGGRLSGNGGQAEISAGRSVGYYGYTDLGAAGGEAGTLVIDPEFLTISTAGSAGDLAYALSLGQSGTFNINDQAIADALHNNHVKLWASNTLSVTEDVDVSTWIEPQYDFVSPGCEYGCYIGDLYGITGNDLTLAAPTINLLYDVILGTGKLKIEGITTLDTPFLLPAPAADVNVDVVNLDGRIYRREVVGDPTTVAGDDQIDSRANTVNVASNAALLQQAVWLSNDAAQGTINVAADTYAESVLISKNVNLRGANAGISGAGVRGAESIIDPNSPGLTINAGGSGSTVNGMMITGATDNGIDVLGASNVSLINNVIHDVDGDGVYADGTSNLVVSDNLIYDIRTKGTDIGSGIQILNSVGPSLLSNTIHDTQWDGIRVRDSAQALVAFNDIDNITRTGIYMGYTSTGLIFANTVTKNKERYGINVDNGENISVWYNDIDNTQLEGIRIYRTKGTNFVSGNSVDTTRRAGGILAEKTQGLTVSGNFIGTTGAAQNINGDGILSHGSHGIVIKGNTITQTKSSAADIGSGIQVRGNNGATIGGPNPGDGNIIFNTGWDGIRVFNSNNVVAQGNDIDNVFRTGIYFGNVLNGSLLNNFITGTIDRYGINYDGGANATISGNDVDQTNRHGIYIHEVGGTNLVSGNSVDSTNNGNSQGDGIHADTVTNLTIADNLVGLNSAVNKIKGDGIFGSGVDGVVIRSNRITNTFSTRVDVGSGVQLLNTNGAMIGGVNPLDANIIYKTGWDGVRVENTNDVVVQGNDIDDVYRTGIYMGYSSNGSALYNAVTKNKERYGINIDNSDTMTVVGNDIDNTQLEGIRIYRTKGTNLIAGNYVDTTRRAGGILADKAQGTTISGNFVGTTGALPNINGDGIRALDSTGIVIKSNTITQTKSSAADIGSGVQVVNSDGAMIGGINPADGNVIFNTGWDGIRVVDSDGVTAQSNDIDNVFRTGIYFGEISNGNVLGNSITGALNRYGINYDGGSDATISGNDIDVVARHGIFIHETAGANLVSGNEVDFTGQDGINGHDVPGLVVFGNFVGMNGGGITGNAIFVDPSPGSVISYNFINGGLNGIISENNDDVAIFGNSIYNVAYNGIEVYGGTNATVGDDDPLKGNYIYNAGYNGIFVHDTAGSVLIKNNGVYLSGSSANVGDDFDGIKVSNIYSGSVTPAFDSFLSPFLLLPGYGEAYVEIADNNVDYTYDDGIDVNSVEGTVYIHDNDIHNIGVGVGPAYPYGDYWGADGISVRNVHSLYDGYCCDAKVSEEYSEIDYGYGDYDVRIVDNSIDSTNDDGIEVVDSGRTLIEFNEIVDVGVGPDPYWSDGYGADGIHVRNVYGEFFYPTFFTLSSYGSGGAVDIFDNYVNVDPETGEFIGFTADDGIQVIDSGDTVIDGNEVANSGMTYVDDGEGEEEYEYARVDSLYPYYPSYGKSDEWGADGIHVLNRGSYDRYPARKLDVESFVFEGGYYEPVSVEITDNFVDNSADDGIEVDGANYVYVDSNDVDQSGDMGILVQGYAGGYPVYDEVYFGEEVTLFDYTPFPLWWTAIVTNNTVNHSGSDGIQIADFDEIVASFNTVDNSGDSGLHINGANNGSVSVEGNAFTDNPVGAHFRSGLIFLNGQGNTFTGGDVGLRFNPYLFGSYLELYDDDGEPDSPASQDPPTNFGGTIGAQIFDGQSTFYVELLNGAFFYPGTPTWLNGLNSTYDGFTPATDPMTQPQYDLLETMFFHWPDGLVDADPNDLGRFWFGAVPLQPLPDVPQERILNTFGAIEDLGGEINVVLLGLPSLPGGGTPPPVDLAGFLNSLTPNAGGDGGEEEGQPSPNNIEPAAGGNEPAQGQAQQTAQNNSSCWLDAASNAQAGAATTFSFSSVVNQTTLAQETNCGLNQP